jgi:hypothetical protein
MRLGRSTQKPWVRAAVLLGLLYALVGIAFAVPDTHVRTWRLAAWAVSAMAFAGHIAYEHFGLRQSPRSAAIHVALAAALGAFGLAIGANIHSLSTASTDQHRRLLLIALGIWPVITAVPAFLVGLGISAVLSRLPQRAHAE